MTHTHLIEPVRVILSIHLTAAVCELSPDGHPPAQQIPHKRRMRLSAGIAVGVGYASLAQVSSFAFVPSATSVSTSSAGRAATQQQQARGHRNLCSRTGGLSVAMSAADDESLGGEGEGEGVETDDTSSQVATKRKKGSELDDIMSEVAGRASDEPVAVPRVMPASSEPIIVPRGAGIAPMSPGPIKADPIPGMDALDVPGKIILDPETLASQQKGLEKIAQQLRRERLDKEAVDAITFGFCPRAELWNGRAAMFGVTVGMLTELWTGQSIPQQVETFAQLLGLLPLDYDTYFQ